MAIKIHDLYKKNDGSWLVYDWRKDALSITLLFTKLEERGEKVNPRDYKCRVYSLGSKNCLGRGRCLYKGTYDECLKVFKARCRYEYIELQVYVAPEGYGVNTYLDNKDEYYLWLYDERCKSREREEKPWRPGDAPWDAPGMSIRDFF